jgi:hypothetical protein
MRIGSWFSRLFHRRPVEPTPRAPTTPSPTSQYELGELIETLAKGPLTPLS